jgi:hypothetical protein
MYIYCMHEKENLRFDVLNHYSTNPQNCPLTTKKVLHLTVTLSEFWNYFAPLAETEQTPITREQVWSGL